MERKNINFHSKCLFMQLNRIASIKKEHWKYLISSCGDLFAFLVSLNSISAAKRRKIMSDSSLDKSRFVSSIVWASKVACRDRLIQIVRLSSKPHKLRRSAILINWLFKEWQFVNRSRTNENENVSINQHNKPFAKLDLLLRALQILFHQHQLSGNLSVVYVWRLQHCKIFILLANNNSKKSARQLAGGK